MYCDRLENYQRLEHLLNSKLLIYVTSDRQGCDKQIGNDDIAVFINQLDKIGKADKISLYLYTRGGDVAAAWNIVNLIQQYCDVLQVIIPHKCLSAGTLLSIGANSIIMTKQATLGPIDPSVNTPFNPVNPSALGNNIPVSVEAVKGYLEFAKQELNIKDDIALSNIMIKLSENVHPLVLGEVYRRRAQIKMLAEKLLKNQISDPNKVQQIISFLCSDSGSHDYIINRKEASEVLGLTIVKPNDETYAVIKNIYDDISAELELDLPFNYNTMEEFNVRRAIIESAAGGK